ncbi:MAG: hypothetical protein AAF958_00810 [Planctomycetota bacterium]
MPKIRLGKDATISGGGLDNDTIKDVTISFGKGETDLSTRGTGGYRATVGTLKECEVSVTVVAKDDATLAALRAVYEAGTAQTLTFSDAGGALARPFEMMGFEVGQELENGIMVTCTYKTTHDDIPAAE